MVTRIITGSFIVKKDGVETPPPGGGLNTVTLAVPVVAISLVEIDAFNCVLLTKVVVRLEPFQRTIETLTNPKPLTVRVNSGSPAVALFGEIIVIEGDGLLIVNVNELEVPPPGRGLNTVTFDVPVAAISMAEIAATSFVLLTKVVGRSDPFHRTTELETKPAPFTISANAGPPAVALFGDSEVIPGNGLIAFPVKETVTGLEVLEAL